MAVAVISLLNTINNIAERDQYLDRDIIVPIDEGHIVTTNPLLGPYATKIAKMWRKLGTGSGFLPRTLPTSLIRRKRC